MKRKMSASVTFVIICLVTLFSAASVSAQNAGAEQKPRLSILSTTDRNSGKDEEYRSVYREADQSLIDQVRDGLSSREIPVNVVESEKDIPADPGRFVLLLKVDRIELGSKRPFGRTAKVKVSYTVQNKDRFDLVRRTHEETSAARWQNCIKKISEQLVNDVSQDIAKKSVPHSAEDKQSALKQTPAVSASETRLQELEKLKAKGLVTEKEYEEKRKEILKEL